MSLWSRPHPYSHVATKRTAAELLFSLCKEGKGRKFEMIGGGGGVRRPVVATIIIIIITVIVYLRLGWNRETNSHQIIHCPMSARVSEVSEQANK